MAGKSLVNGQPHIVDQRVGRKIAEKRLSLGFSQKDLGDALGLTFQQVQKYEKGVNRVSASKLWGIARFLDVEPGYFFEGLPRDTPGPAEDEAPAPSAATRDTLEIARLAPQLPLAQQKLALKLLRSMAAIALS